MSKFGNAGETTADLHYVYLEAPQLLDWEHPLFASRYTQDTTYFRVRISASSDSATHNAGPFDGPLPLSSGGGISCLLVKEGWCWWYRKYAPGDTVLEGLETEARETRKGLWADSSPIPPWEWRKR